MLTNFSKFVSTTNLLLVDPIQPYKLQYNNFITTTQLIPPGYSLALESIISYYYGGFIKCDPKRFCGITIRLKDSIGITTHNLFRSGKMNTVGSKTIEHARYSAHIIRQYISKIRGVYLLNDKLVLSNIEKSTTFLRFTVQCIAVSATLSRRPNLKHILDVAPDLAKWTPDMFPGLQFLVWIRPQSQCKCVKTKKKKKGCNCNVRVILFDTGKIVITGSKQISDVNCALELLELLFKDDDYITTDPLLPSHLRNKARKELLQSNIVEFDSFALPASRVKQKEEEFDIFSILPKKKKQKEIK